MCGRFVSVFTTEDLLEVAAELGGTLQPADELKIDVADWNVAPSRVMPLFLAGADGHVVIETKTWGFAPGWKRDGGARPLINARCESAAEKPTFRHLTRSGRCLVPMSGYYEWKTDPHGRKVPYYISSPDGAALLTGALFEEKSDAFVILTRSAPEVIREIHDRSPLLLGPADADEWLHAAEWPDPAVYLDRAPTVGARRVSRDVNSVRNNGPRLLESPDTGLFGP